MNRGLVQALILIAIGAGWGLARNAVSRDPLPLRGAIGPPAVAEAGAALPALTAPEALAAWEEGTVFLDVRSPLEFEEHRVRGALPFPADDLETAYFDRVMGFGAEFPLLVYGAGPDSFRVRRAAQYLLDAGQSAVTLVVCGVDSLVEAGVDPGSGPAEEMW